jgi:hypothetical protein
MENKWSPLILHQISSFISNTGHLRLWRLRDRRKETSDSSPLGDLCDSSLWLWRDGQNSITERQWWVTCIHQPAQLVIFQSKSVWTVHRAEILITQQCPTY